jgi:photosystem II stability/assembly factor-like uncharacterized protein
VAASSDGMKIVAVDHELGLIYRSTDGGTTWSAVGAPKRRWRSVSASADGTKLAARTDFGTTYGEAPAIYTSANSGATWTLTIARGAVS